MEQARILIVHSALIAGGVCVLLYIVDFAVTLLAMRRAVKTGSDAAADTTSLNNKSILGVSDLGALVEALTKLAEGLSKVGPGVTSMIGAVLFFAIAAVGAGVRGHGAARRSRKRGRSRASWPGQYAFRRSQAAAPIHPLIPQNTGGFQDARRQITFTPGLHAGDRGAGRFGLR